MKYALQTLRPALARTTGLALVMALAVSFVGLTHADTFYQLTVNVTDSCGPVVAQVTVVNGPDDGAFGITNNNGQFVFNNLHAGVFYLHITAADHTSKDTDTIVLNSNKTVNVTLDRTNGSCNPPPGDTCQDPNATNFGGPLPCVYPPNPPTNNPPAGVLDATNCELIGGWAVDNDTPTKRSPSKFTWMDPWAAAL